MAKAKPSPTFSASGNIGSNNCVYHGYSVTVVTATGSINLRNGSISGQIIETIPAATAAGSTKNYTDGITFQDGIFVEFNGGATGSVVIYYE